MMLPGITSREQTRSVATDRGRLVWWCVWGLRTDSISARDRLLSLESKFKLLTVWCFRGKKLL